MSKTTPLIRVAHVKFSPQGKSYATLCERSDIVENDEVEVLMYAGTDRAYYMEGVVTDVSHQRWKCRCQVVNLSSEVECTIDSDGTNNRHVKAVQRHPTSMVEWRARKRKYQDGLPSSHRAELKRIYDEIAGKDGEPAYFGDGIWITPMGDIFDDKK